MKNNRKSSLFLTGMLIAATAGIGHAATITLNGTGDAIGAASFAAGTNWSDATAPSAANDYVVAASQSLRTVSNTTTTALTFGGNSLTLNGDGSITTANVGRLLAKGVASLSIGRLTLNGGLIENATDTGGSAMTIGGGIINVVAPSGIMRISQNGPVVINSTLTGTGTLTLGGQTNNGASVTFNAVNTFTGNLVLTAASGPGFILGDTGSLMFAIGQSGINNNITATVNTVAAFNGAFTFDLTSAAAAPGSSWTIVATSNITETYAGTFSVKDQTGATWTQLNDVWTSASGTYQFSEATGVLSVIPEPSSLLLGAVGMLAVCGRRRRQA